MQESTQGCFSYYVLHLLIEVLTVLSPADVVHTNLIVVHRQRSFFLAADHPPILYKYRKQEHSRLTR